MSPGRVAEMNGALGGVAPRTPVARSVGKCYARSVGITVRSSPRVYVAASAPPATIRARPVGNPIPEVQGSLWIRIGELP